MPTLRPLRSIANFWDGRNQHQQNTRAHATTLDVGTSEHTPTGTVKRHRLRKTAQSQRSTSNLLDVSVNNPGTFTLHHHQSENPLAEFRRRLARKASTFSLRTRRRQGERDQDEAAREEEKLRELVLSGSHKGSFQSEQEQLHVVCPPDKSYNKEDQTAPFQQVSTHEQLLARSPSVATVREWDPAETPSVKELPPLPTAIDSTENTLALQDFIRKVQGTYITQEVAGGFIAVKKMASEQAQPPVPYTRLKEITELACESALSEVTTYTHTDTEKWNTTIINSILGALVHETTQKASAGSSVPAQPQFKYVVNSTIIQHAASSSSSSADESKKPSGRRGMHAASGAYWNNEKDGMWSFKYPGADSKGLDVIVGIIWVWVG